MLLNLSVWGLNSASVGFISLVHLLGALGLILALLYADLCQAEEPRRWRTAASTRPPRPKRRAGISRPAVSSRHAWAGAHR